MRLISDENKTVLVKRIKSLSWRGGMMIGALIVNFALTSLELLELPVGVIVLLGLVLGEISKWLNTSSVPRPV